MNNAERRSGNTRRVPVETLVEMCGLDTGATPAFEAKSVDVSGRGMQVQTAFLPEVGSPLVCRFEHQGREIIVEGEVAWRRDDATGGHFGLRFTALDSGSVDALRELSGLELQAVEELHGSTQAAEPEPSVPLNQPGTRVRLHIDGLGAPMRARVRDGGKRRVHVGSNLEFLMLGKHLDLENLERDARRSARIEAVEVVLDPQTQIPQLVVALRYDDVDDTPEPAVIDTNLDPHQSSPLEQLGIDAVDSIGHLATESGADTQTPIVGSHELAGLDQAPAPERDVATDGEAADDEELQHQADAFRGRVGTAAVNVAKQVGHAAARMGATSSQGLRWARAAAGAGLQELARKRARPKQPRRATAQHPGGPFSVQSGRLSGPGANSAPLRKQQAAPQGMEHTRSTERKKRARKVAVAAGAVALVLTLGAVAMHEPTEPPGAEEPEVATSVEVSVPEDVTEVDEQGNPVVRAAEVKRLEQPKAKPTGVVADVPLFGPTPLATMEPAPLGPSPQQTAQQPPAAAKSKPADESFADAPRASNRSKPEDVKPWGRGRMHLPIIHRLRLDAPGGALEGAIHPTGFSVVIPGRKIMESARGIQKRDKRIARIQTRNSSSGAQVSFKFRDGVPGYRVRLRKDFVEFLISSPQDKK
jgi:hypothetical protein